jgi:hypothetical protein
MRLRGKIETEERKVTWHFIIAFLLEKGENNGK